MTAIRTAVAAVALLAAVSTAQTSMPADKPTTGPTFVETARDADTSTAVYTPGERRGGSVGSSVSIALEVCRLAIARGREYVVILDEYDEGPQRRVYVLGFVDRADADPRAIFGDRYVTTRPGRDPGKVFGVETFRPLLNRPPGPATTAPAAR